MRISDWSSDVCSSDLIDGVVDFVVDGGVVAVASGSVVRFRRGCGGRFGGTGGLVPVVLGCTRAIAAGRRPRQSGWGWRVGGRVVVSGFRHALGRRYL